ncbi:MAG TPA: hypothetical protein VNQ77_09805 [Frankiaceae bacterium]|nr:hypothetical protein [Frankiaceae bacterium]
MTTLWRGLPALLIGAALLAPVSPAAASESCSFYRWDEPTKEYVLVARLAPRQKFEDTHVYLVDWHCQYCVPAMTARNPDDVFESVDDAQVLTQRLVQQTVEAVTELQVTVPSPGPGSGSPAAGDPWNYPDCPKVAPLWDEKALDAVGGIG